jgi:hypothetical protein
MNSRMLRSAIVALCCLPLLPAQGAAQGAAQGSALRAAQGSALRAASGARQPTFVRIEGADGQPVAHATVTFAGGKLHLGSEVAPDDVLQVAGDARGRAQAKLLPDCCYVAWAIGPDSSAAGCVRAEVTGWFAAGAVVTLRCGPPEPVRRLPLQGLEAWSQPLHFVASTRRPGVAVELARDGDAVTLPPGPWLAIEAQDAAGVPLWAFTDLSGPLRLPPPQVVPVRVLDERGQPLAAVPLRHRIARRPLWPLDGFGGVVEDRWRELGATDADGRCTITVPYPSDPLGKPHAAELVLFAAPADRPAVAGGIYQNALFGSDRRVRPTPGEPRPNELVFVCREPLPLLGNAGPVPPGTVAHLSAVCKLFLDQDQYHQDSRSFTAAIAPDGGFVFHDVPAELHACRLSLLPPPSSPVAMPLLPAQPGRDLPELLTARSSGPLADGVADIALQVLEPSGGPARGCIGHLVPISERSERSVLARDALVRVPLDARGAAELRLLPGRWALLVLGELGYAAELLTVASGAEPRRLTMLPLLQMPLELRDAAGRPIAGARLVLRRSATRGTNEPLQTLLHGLRNQQRSRWAELRSDGEGRLVVPIVPVDGLVQHACLRWDGGETAEFVLAERAEPLLLRPQ